MLAFSFRRANHTNKLLNKLIYRMAYFCDKKIYFVLTTYSSGGDLFFLLTFCMFGGFAQHLSPIYFN